MPHDGWFLYDFVMSAHMSVSERITLMTTQSHILRALSSHFLRSVGFGGNTGPNASLLLTSADMELVTAAPNVLIVFGTVLTALPTNSIFTLIITGSGTGVFQYALNLLRAQ